MRFPPLPPIDSISGRELQTFRARAADNILRLSEGSFDQDNTFSLDVGKTYPKTCYLFLSLKEGKLHILSRGTMLKDRYTVKDKEESARLQTAVQRHGDYVQVGCSLYRVCVKGDFSDAGYLEFVGSM